MNKCVFLIDKIPYYVCKEIFVLQYKKMAIDDLILHAQQNDLKALEELIKREQKKVFASFAYLSKKSENVSDLTQEALLRLARGIHNLKNPKSFNCWLNHIITNVFYDDLRKIRRLPDFVPFENEEADFELQIPDTHCKPNEKCLSLELGQLIRDAICDLPNPFKIAIVLRELQGLSYEQIAEVTNSSVGTVKSRIARARGKLQDGLKNYF